MPRAINSQHSPLIALVTVICSMWFSCACSAQQKLHTPPNPDVLYENFAQGYRELDAERLAALYTSEAVLMNLYEKTQPSSLQGREAIRQYFAEFFQPFKSNNVRFTLRFKIISRKETNDMVWDNGVSRLDVYRPKAAPQTVFAKFSTVLVREGTTWKLRTDATASANFLEYENAPVYAGKASIPPLLPDEDVLFPEFYDTLLGDYLTDENQIIVIGRSQRRLFAYFENTHEFRGLQKVDATTWTAGNTVIADSSTMQFRFQGTDLEITRTDGINKQKSSVKARKQDLYRTEKITYPTLRGSLLGGTLFRPKKSNGKALVLVHGSGGQDRNGYASIIRLIADIFAREGLTVLTYDKQGVGSSIGNWEEESFSDLADDALAGIAYLKNKQGLKLNRIGLAGSSQAGWVIAKAIEHTKKSERDKREPNVDFALTIGAAGSGISVIEQNLYNTKIQMECTRTYRESQIAGVLAQQRAFFNLILAHAAAGSDSNDYRRKTEELDRITTKLAADTAIRDWLFPTSSGIDFTRKNQWYTALEIAFNPLEIWHSYKKPALMLFGEYDDSTPTAFVQEQIARLRNPNIQNITLKGAQHLGLETTSLCAGDLAGLRRFHPMFFASLKSWLKSF